MAATLNMVELDASPANHFLALTEHERETLIRVLRCVEDNWTLDPAEELILLRLQMLDMPHRLGLAEI